jgi:putative transposase
MLSDPGDCPCLRYRANTLGRANAIRSPPPLWLALAADDACRHELYRGLLRTALDDPPLGDLRRAPHPDQPIGNNRFDAEIEAMSGQRRELGKRERPRKKNEKEPLPDAAQQRLPL